MNGNNNDPMRTAAARVQASKAIYRIMRAAVASGGYGAAAAAVRETLPVLFKLLIGVFLAAGVFSVVILTALPNIFFGFRSSHTDAVIRMTDQAAAIGGAYMSLEDFESAYIDSVVENIAEAYEEIGVDLDQHPPSRQPVDQTVIPQHPHIAVHMRDDRNAVQIFASLLNLVQHALAPGDHRRLYEQVRKVLDINKQERHIRGGLATREKYRKDT